LKARSPSFLITEDEGGEEEEKKAVERDEV
jgi:hypothetical protein